MLSALLSTAVSAALWRIISASRRHASSAVFSALVVLVAFSAVLSLAFSAALSVVLFVALSAVLSLAFSAASSAVLLVAVSAVFSSG